MFLSDVLSEHFNTGETTVIPEFPLRIGTLYPDDINRNKRGAENNQSVKVDFAAFNKNMGVVYLVELKTDVNSRNDTQDDYLKSAREIDFKTLIGDVKKIAWASNSKHKYGHLLYRLELLGLIKAPEELYNELFQDKGRYLKEHHEKIEILPPNKDVAIKIVYVQPKKTEKDDRELFNYIYFEKFASLIESKGTLGKVFAECLLSWQSQAGTTDPRTIGE